MLFRSIPILSTGNVAYPMHRPVGAVWAAGGGRGRLAVLGSAEMLSDDWLDKEDNSQARKSLLGSLRGFGFAGAEATHREPARICMCMIEAAA